MAGSVDERSSNKDPTDNRLDTRDQLYVSLTLSQ